MSNNSANRDDTSHIKIDNDIVNDVNYKISICIPRVDNSINENYIRRVFNQVLIEKEKPASISICVDRLAGSVPSNNSQNKINFIERIDLIEKKNEKNEAFKRAFIHFRNWDKLTSHNSRAIWDKLQAGEIIKIMHKQPNYWKCSLSRVPRPINQAKPTQTEPQTQQKPTHTNSKDKKVCKSNINTSTKTQTDKN